ncbi:metallophosphoesterase [uncultured Phenylobacterium sp.]|uniref:metallophosphoesterase family protein n=1 Tax=uncultured Phenylobacterium sp. TaxID=349273 RepID=UPI0025D7F45E|nr:metallophosphoesterase [uncultured Phenylobacterium sp.]
MTAFRLAHLSDPHLAPPPARFRAGDLVSKRLLSRLAWRRKHRRHSRAVLDALTADIAARGPDHIAITGDLVNFATPEEFDAARIWLEGLGDPADVTVSPGNHDALVARGAPASFAPWARWLGDGPPGFPHLRVRGPVAIVNLSSAVPTPAHSARGRLGAAQIEAAAGLLREAQGLYRIVLIHHPPVPGLVSPRKSLVDAEALGAVMAQAGAELVLHGHAHEGSLAVLRAAVGSTPVLGVPSASSTARATHRAARWQEIAVTRDGEGFRAEVTARGVTADLRCETLGRYHLG